MCIVDQVLERICTGVKVTQLGVVGHCSYCGVERSDHPTDVHRLDVGEVREDAGPGSAGGLQIKTTSLVGQIHIREYLITVN